MEEQARYTGTRLGLVMKEQGRTKRWLAQRIGVSESLVGKVISGDRTMPEYKARLAAAALGLPFGVLFELRDGGILLPAEEREAIPA
jgi:transcriptional regulator with XRE-family HTH domain